MNLRGDKIWVHFSLEKAIEILEQTPSTVKSLLGNLSDGWTTDKENSEGWSPFDVIGHYIHGEETNWIPPTEIILRQDENRTFEPFNRFTQLERSKGKTLSELLKPSPGCARKTWKFLNPGI